MTEWWYNYGLKFQCLQCGNCCTGAPGYVWVNREEIQRTADFLNIPLKRFMRRYLRSVNGRYSFKEKSNGDCVFYDRAKSCLIYPVRPKQCITYPFWYENLLSTKYWERMKLNCPGVGSGNRYTGDEIREKLWGRERESELK